MENEVGKVLQKGEATRSKRCGCEGRLKRRNRNKNETKNKRETG